MNERLYEIILILCGLFFLMLSMYYGLSEDFEAAIWNAFICSIILTLANMVRQE